jgi:hypothetical protein
MLSDRVPKSTLYPLATIERSMAGAAVRSQRPIRRFNSRTHRGRGLGCGVHSSHDLLSVLLAEPRGVAREPE